jgi:hypothetical protein
MFNNVIHKKKKNIKFSYDQNINLNIFFSNFVQNFPIFKNFLQKFYPLIPFFPITCSNWFFSFKFNFDIIEKKNFVCEVYYYKKNIIRSSKLKIKNLNNIRFFKILKVIKKNFQQIKMFSFFFQKKMKCFFKLNRNYLYLRLFENLK